MQGYPRAAVYSAAEHSKRTQGAAVAIVHDKHTMCWCGAIMKADMAAPVCWLQVVKTAHE